MTQLGILVPPGHTEIHQTVQWETADELLTILSALLGDRLAAAAVAERGPRVPGGVRMWWQYDRPLAEPGTWNDRALAVAWPPPPSEEAS